VTTVGLARAALVQDLHERDRRRPGPVPRPQHPVLLCNPWSGGGKVEKFGLVALAEELGVEVMMLDRGLDLEQLARDAVARGADCLGMAGGDGSQALVASIAVEHGLPFVCVSAGTRNHFALDLGIDRDDPRACLYAYRDAIERRIDYATVGDRLFVNNVSLGIYATIVQQEGYREAKAETTKALLREMLGRTEQPFDLQFTEPDGAEVDGAFLIQVSNNPYVLGATLDASQRRRLDTGVLGVVAVTGATGRDAAQVVALSALGQRRRSRNWHEFTTERFEVRSRSGKAYAGIDGEALDLETPLEFRIHQRGLRLLVREGNVTAAERRRARDVAVGDLFALARGRDPLASGQR
jgi:diacylglycerol kinase family enzyme